MKRAMAAILATAAVAAALLHDFPKWLAVEGAGMFESGKVAGALSAWSRLETRPGWAATAQFNKGAALCRIGNYSSAVAEFRKAASAGDGKVRAVALYNLGTARIIMASRPGTASAAAERQLRYAVQSLQQCVALASGDEAAAANLKLAQRRLDQLAREKGRGERQQRPETPSRKPERGGEPERGAAKPGRATDRDQQGAKRRDAVDRDEALRMLDEARGRESLRSARAALTSGTGERAIDKDW